MIYSNNIYLILIIIFIQENLLHYTYQKDESYKITKFQYFYVILIDFLKFIFIIYYIIHIIHYYYYILILEGQIKKQKFFDPILNSIFE